DDGGAVDQRHRDRPVVLLLRLLEEEADRDRDHWKDAGRDQRHRPPEDAGEDERQRTGWRGLLRLQLAQYPVDGALVFLGRGRRPGDDGRGGAFGRLVRGWLRL